MRPASEARARGLKEITLLARSERVSLHKQARLPPPSPSWAPLALDKKAGASFDVGALDR